MKFEGPRPTQHRWCARGCRTRFGTRRIVRRGRFSRNAEYTQLHALVAQLRPSVRMQSKSFQRPQR